MQTDVSTSAAGKIYRREVRIEWGDCDPAGIVFYPHYLALFDANTAYLLEALGLPMAELIRTYDIVGLPLVDVQAKFVMPSMFGDAVIVESHVSHWRLSTLTIQHRILRDGEVAVHGHETRVWAARDPGRPGRITVKPIPQQVLDRFGRSGS